MPSPSKKEKVNKRNSSESHLPGCTFERHQCFFLIVRSSMVTKKQTTMFILFFQLEQHSQKLFYVCNTSLVENVYYNFSIKEKKMFRQFFSKVQLGIRDFGT